MRGRGIEERSSRAFLCGSGAMDSRVTTKRVPIKMPLAPSARHKPIPARQQSLQRQSLRICTASTTFWTSATVPIVLDLPSGWL